MSDRDARFRRLRPQPGDLFEHFGVPLGEPPPPEPEASGPNAARPCGHCGWFVLAAVAACPLCGSTERVRV